MPDYVAILDKSSYNRTMPEDTKLVFVDGKLLLEGRDYTWHLGRLKFKDTVHVNSLGVTVVYITGCRFEYGPHGRDINLILDPSNHQI